MQQADRLLTQIVRRGGPWLSALVAASVSAASLQLALPYLLGRTVDGLVDDAASGRMWLTFCVAVLVGIVVCESLVLWASGVTGARASVWLRRTIADLVLGAGPEITRRFPEGDLVTRLGLNAEEAGQAPAALVAAVALLIPTVGSVVALALIDLWMALTLVVGLVFITFVLRRFLSDTTTIARGYQKAQGEIAGRLVDALAGGRTIAAAGTAEVEVRRVLAPLPELRARGMELWRANARAGVQAGLAVPLLEVATLAVGGLRLAAGTLSVGALYAATRYAVLGAGLSAALGSVSSLARSRAAGGRITQLLDAPRMHYGDSVLPHGCGVLEFQDVVLPDRTESIDVRFEGGSLTAVVGRSGAGKSLLAAVAGRLTDPRQGTVRLDGVPLPDLSRRALREAIGFAFERPVLVGDCVADAIGLARRHDPAQLARAMRAARADEFVRAMPQGSATPLKDAPLSGGERQRLGLARAFAHGERLLILDDATSSLDTATECQVGAALTGELSGRTRLVVAHRVATAAKAQRVLWLEEGRVRGHDRHGVLWQDPDYRAVFQAEGADA